MDLDKLAFHNFRWSALVQISCVPFGFLSSGSQESFKTFSSANDHLEDYFQAPGLFAPSEPWTKLGMTPHFLVATLSVWFCIAQKKRATAGEHSSGKKLEPQKRRNGEMGRFWIACLVVLHLRPTLDEGPGSKFLGTKLDSFEGNWILELDPALDRSSCILVLQIMSSPF